MLNSKKLYLYRLVSLFLPESRCFGVKNRLLRWCGVKIGNDVRIYSSTMISGIGNLEIGDDVFIGPRTIISASGDATIKIGSHVNIGAMCYIVTGTHLIDVDGMRSCGEGFNRDVIIEDGAWLAAHIVILPGVMEDRLTIGPKAVVQGGSVVAASVPGRVMVQGNPAVQTGMLKSRIRRRRP